MTTRPPVSQHILPTASNLLGLCFVILSFIHVEKLNDATLIDDALVFSIVLFFTASVLSYFSSST